MALKIPPKGDSFRRENIHFANLKVSAQNTPDLTVKVSEGGFWNDDTTYIEVNGGTSPAFAAPGSTAKLVVVTIDLSGDIVLIDGTPNSSPDLPAIPSDRIPLAAVLLNSTDILISEDMVFDLRPTFHIGADVNNISVSDVAGLSSQLDLKASITALNNGLDTKAGIGGTASSIFALNANHTGVPTADASFRVERGSSPDVEIRWNESIEFWELTNDGTSFGIIGTNGSTLQASVTANESAIGINTSNIAINTSDIAVLQASLAAVVATGSNIGSTGEGVFASATGTLLNFKNLVGGSGIELTATASTIIIDASGVAGGGGEVVQTFFVQDGTLATITNQLIPNDDTIPQITEGAEVLTLVCSGLTIGNILEIDWHVDFASNGGGVSLMVPLFIDAITDAIAVTQQVPGIANALISLGSKARFIITTSSHTIRVRMGSVSNVIITINGTGAAARFGGTSSTHIAAKELTP